MRHDRSAALADLNRTNYPLTKIIGKRCCHKMLASSPASILNGAVPGVSVVECFETVCGVKVWRLRVRLG
jgi:hypothetical protein